MVFKLRDYQEDLDEAIRFGHQEYESIAIEEATGDDVLDFMGTEEELGKPVGNDLLQGTLTLPVLLFAQRNPDEPPVQRLRAGGADPADVQAVIDLVRESPAIEETLAVMDDYREKARAALQGVPANRARESLEALVDYVGQRRV